MYKLRDVDAICQIPSWTGYRRKKHYGLLPKLRKETRDVIKRNLPRGTGGDKSQENCWRRASCRTLEQLMPSLSALVAIQAGMDTFFRTDLVSVRAR